MFYFIFQISFPLYSSPSVAFYPLISYFSLSLTNVRTQAWKRLWDQVGRLEVIYARKLSEQQENENDNDNENLENNSNENSLSKSDPQNPGVSVSSLMIGAPVVCLQLLTKSHIEMMKIMKEKKEREFGSLMQVWELGREKHERSLKPRLSAADCSGREERSFSKG